MDATEIPGTTQRLRRAFGRSQGYFQQTFRTPSRQLAAFSAAVLGAHTPPESGLVTIDQVVSRPKNLESLLTVHNLAPTLGRDWIITGAGLQEVTALLEAAWGDSVDFYFSPMPKRYHLFADHDQYTTIFGATKGHVSKVATALVSAGFSRVDGYERDW